MASFMYNCGPKAILDAALAGTALDLKAKLVMTNTTVDTENDAIDRLSDFTTLDTHDGLGYVEKTLASITTSQDDANNRSVLDCADIVWSSLGTGSRSIEGVIVYHEISASDANRVPILFLDTSNVASNGGDITLAINASGLFAMAGTGSP